MFEYKYLSDCVLLTCNKHLITFLGAVSVGRFSFSAGQSATERCRSFQPPNK